MKMDRLIGILSILLQRERVTAPELAEQFEVSRRTIQRDIEALGRAGIPIATAQGAGAASPSWRATGWTGRCSPPRRWGPSWRGSGAWTASAAPGATPS